MKASTEFQQFWEVYRRDKTPSCPGFTHLHAKTAQVTY